jgi:hypothetical protein
MLELIITVHLVLGIISFILVCKEIEMYFWNSEGMTIGEFIEFIFNLIFFSCAGYTLFLLMCVVKYKDTINKTNSTTNNILNKKIINKKKVIIKKY